MVWPLILAGVAAGAFVGSQIDDATEGLTNIGGNAPVSNGPFDSAARAINSLSGLIVIGGVAYGAYWFFIKK